MCGEQQQVGAEGGPGRLVGEAGHNLLGGDIQRLHALGSGQFFGGHMEGVDIAGGGVCEPDGRVALVALQGGGGPGRIVAGQDPLEQLGRGGRTGVRAVSCRTRGSGRAPRLTPGCIGQA